MYWVELDYRNGKTIRKEYNNINDSYAVLKRCAVVHRFKNSTDVINIRTGFDDCQTGEWNPKTGLRAVIR